MKYRVAIQPDPGPPENSSAPIWTRILQCAGHEVRPVDVYRADILDQLRGCHGFMWRHAHFSDTRQIAKRLLPVLERDMGMAVYPDQNTCWHYDDKIAQRYLLEAHGIPIPKTWVWFDADLACEWLATAEFPLVMKLWSGASSTNVRLIRTRQEAEHWIKRLFGAGVRSIQDSEFARWPRFKRFLKPYLKPIMPHLSLASPKEWDLHKNYVLFQEFLPGNDFDTRVTVIGDRAFGLRRFNRPNDFRASGSGNLDVTPSLIDPEAILLAFTVAARLRTQSVAIDCLRRGEERVVGEISYTYVSSAIHKCPGHWGPDLQWHVGQMWPEEAQAQDFLKRLDSLSNESR